MHTCKLHSIVYQPYISESIDKNNTQINMKAKRPLCCFFPHIRLPTGIRRLFDSVTIYWAPTVSSELFQGHGVIRSFVDKRVWREAWLRETAAFGPAWGLPALWRKCALPRGELMVGTAWLRGRSRRRKRPGSLCMGSGALRQPCNWPSFMRSVLYPLTGFSWRWVLWVLGVLSHLIPTVPLWNSMIISILHMKTWKHRQAK